MEIVITAHTHDEDSHDNLHVLDIFNEMRRVSLESRFIFSLMENCQRYEGIRDLMEMWFKEEDSKERDQIIADLEESLEDILEAPKQPEEKLPINFNDLETMRDEILQFKKTLRNEVDRHGGISELSRRSGIPQPSLSRFFHSSAMPRRTTLYKIAKALNLSESSIVFRWTK